MRISFSGTRLGLNDWQKQQLRAWLDENSHRVMMASHGLCIGSDIDFHREIKECSGLIYIAGFPSTNLKTRYRGTDLKLGFMAEPKAPLLRNLDILHSGRDLLIAAPLEMSENGRSGTWHAIRHAKKMRIPIHYLWRQQTYQLA